MERPSEEEDRLGPIPTFLDSDEESDLVEVSEATAELLTERCTLGLRNDARLKARRRYPLPKVPATKTPQLDGFIKSEVPMATRKADKELARLQSLVLDSLAPCWKQNKGEDPQHGRRPRRLSLPPRSW